MQGRRGSVALRPRRERARSARLALGALWAIVPALAAAGADAASVGSVSGTSAAPHGGWQLETIVVAAIAAAGAVLAAWVTRAGTRLDDRIEKKATEIIEKKLASAIRADADVHRAIVSALNDAVGSDAALRTMLARTLLGDDAYSSVNRPSMDAPRPPNEQSVREADEVVAAMKKLERWMKGQRKRPGDPQDPETQDPE